MAVKPRNTVRVDVASQFGERPWDKDEAVRVQREELVPAVRSGKAVVFDFSGVEMLTQSFAHSLVSMLRKELGDQFQDLVYLENTNRLVESVMKLVTEW